MTDAFRRLRAPLIAIAGLALSTGLAFGAQPPEAASWGLSNAANHAGKTVPVGAADESVDETADEDTETDEDTDTDETTEVEGAEDAGENCSTDPTTLTEEELAAMRHGSIVCWAAQQTEWPEWFANHGSFVKCWAHQGKADAPSCTEDPTAGQPAAEAAAQSHGQGNSKGKGKAKSQTGE